MVSSVQSKLEGSEADLVEKAHSIMRDMIKKVMNKNSDTEGKDVTDITDSKPLDNLKLTNNVLKDDASTDCLEVNKKENQTDDGARNPRTAYLSNCASHKNPDEVLHKAVEAVSNKDADAMKPDQDLNIINNTNMKTADISKKDTIKLI